MLYGKTTANRVSRFVEEIDKDDFYSSYVPKGFSYSDKSREETYNPVRIPKSSGIIPPKASAPVPPKPAESAQPDYSVGDRVVHKAFGPGVISAMKPMGNDFFITVAFDDGKSKNFMLRAAKIYMKKE